MKSAFSNVSVDADTEILGQYEVSLGHFDVLYQRWYWDGITAESLIFVSKDVESLSDDALEDKVRSSPMVKENSRMTISRGEEYTFVNFNFMS